MPAPERRTIGELMADSDALARETLLDATPENAPAMVRLVREGDLNQAQPTLVMPESASLSAK